MRPYDERFREEAIKLSDDIGLAPAANQLGVPYQTLSEWRKKRTREGTRDRSKTKNKEPISREEQLDENKQAKINLRKAKAMHKPVYFLDKNTHRRND